MAIADTRFKLNTGAEIPALGLGIPPHSHTNRQQPPNNHQEHGNPPQVK